jgi:hypothetical protein
MSKRKQEDLNVCICSLETCHVTELKIFLAIVSHVAVLYKPSVQDYRCKSPTVHTNYRTSVTLSCVRFLAVLMVLHLNKNETQVTEDNQILMPCTIFAQYYKAWIQHVKENICLKKKSTSLKHYVFEGEYSSIYAWEGTLTTYGHVEPKLLIQWY